MYIQSGYNAEGEIGNGTVQSNLKPTCISKVRLDLNKSVINYKNPGETGEQITGYISAGFNLLYDTVEQGTLEFTSLDEEIATVSEDGIVTAEGIGQTYIRVYNEQNNCYSAVKVNVNGNQGKTFPKIVGGNNHFVALKANGEVWTWGYNGYGNLGLGDNDKKTKPTRTNIYDSKSETEESYGIDVAAGTQHSLVLKSDGTVWAAGMNNYGQLGNGTASNSNVFTQVKLNETEYLTDIIAIACEQETSHAIAKDRNNILMGKKCRRTTRNK